MSSTHGYTLDQSKKQFCQAWEAVGGDHAEQVFADLVALYAQGRVYHDFDHIRNMLAMADEVVPQVTLSPAFIVALFFHDAIYEPGNKDNEALSAEYAVGLLPTAEPAIREQISGMILATQFHRSDDAQEQLMIDLDLSFLGIDATGFEENVEKLIKEFSQYDRETFLQGQAAYLKRFLDEEYIYYTPAFRQRFETTAKANLAAFVHTYLDPS